MVGSRSTDGWLSVSEAGRVLGVSRTTLLAAEEAGILVPIRTPGGHRRYDPDDLDRYLGRQAGTGVAPRQAPPKPATPTPDAVRLVPVVRAALRPLVQALDADSAGIYLADEQELRFCGGFGIARWLADRLADTPAPHPIQQAFTARAQRGFDPASIAFPESRTAGHGLAVPLRQEGTALGALFVVTPANRALLPGEARIIDAFADLIATVVAEQLRITQLERRLAQIATLAG